MIILSDDIIFRKAVIHLLNVELGKFAPAQDLFMMQPDVIELVRKQVCYLLNSDELKAADWNTKEPVFQKLEQMNEKDDKSFIQTSAYLADRLFDIMCDSVEIPSADLLCLSFQTNQEIYGQEMCEKEEIRFTSGPVWIPSYTATDQKSKDKCNKNDGKSG